MLVAHSLTAMNTVCRKGWLQRTGHIRYGMDIYVLLAHPIAALYFFLIAGGNVPLNGSSAGYALVYAAVCLLSVFLVAQAAW